MKELPKNQLSPKIKRVWRLNDLIWLTLTFLLCAVIFGAVYLASLELWSLIVALIMLALYVLGIIIFVVVIPPIRHIRWRYEVNEDFLDIARGIIWKRRFIIPFIRVQHTDTHQGPILRAFKLSSVTVSTAAGNHSIPGLDCETAEQLRDRAAELARIAQEDV
ncbi:MAG: PH domain-containing protein [Coriobacteriia bacterium]|nr:PH domain-containing protein [Coriobacteriia bacterium]MCL2750734.1 PH domain-containing protein [Coriobacteriia bacterium]